VGKSAHATDGYAYFPETILCVSTYHIFSYLSTMLIFSSVTASTNAIMKDVAPQSCAMVPRWRFFGSCICS